MALLLWCCLASSVAAQDIYYNASLNGQVKNSALHTTACEKLHVALGYTYVGATVNTSTVYNCIGKRSPTGGNEVLGTASRRQCSVSSPYFKEDTGTCSNVPHPPKCPAGVPGVGSWKAGKTGVYTGYPSPFETGGCVSGCKVKMKDVKNCHSYGTGFDYCEYQYESTGDTCSVGDGTSAPETPPADPNPPRTDVPPFVPPQGDCPKGTYQGGVNSAGTPMCYGPGSDPKKPKPPPPKTESEKTEQGEDGSSTHTKTTKTTNSDGSVTTVTVMTVTRPDGSKETTVTADTSKTPVGQPGKDESKQEDEKYDLCKQNPNLNICRNSSVAGTCGQISCQGDAIQCATLRAAAAMECKGREEEQKLRQMASHNVGELILSRADPAQGDIDAALKGTEVDMSQSKIDDSSFVAAQCMGDKSFVYSGRTITIPISRFCGMIEPLKYAIVAAAWIIAYTIVSKSVLSS
jgi:hypothetical protein